MVPEVLGCFERTVTMLQASVVDLSEAEMVRQPSGAPNHAMWTLGHVVYSCQAIAGELGVQPWLPPRWESLFGTGSSPSASELEYPTKAAVVEALADASGRVRRALLERGEAGLAAPLPDARYRTVLPTVGHAVVQVLGGHTAYHAGQLATWRRTIGREPVDGFT